LGKPGTAVILIKDNSKLVVMVSIGIEEAVRVIFKELFFIAGNNILTVSRNSTSSILCNNLG